MNKSLPLDRKKIDAIVNEQRVDIKNASIRQVNLIVIQAEKELKAKFIRMEFGVPGLNADPIAWQYECKMIETRKVNSDYPPFNGTEEYRTAASRFIKKFTDVDIPPSNIVATCGAQQGCFLSLALTGRANQKKDTIVFMEPGFSVNKLQIKFLGLKSASVDLYERKTFLKRLEDRLKKGDVAALLWSSPNNPSWVVLSDEELKEIGSMLTKYDVIGIEDNAYFGMDFRKDYSKPGQEPFVPTIANHTANYVLLFSSSKIFNYAGQRIGFAAISPELAVREFPNFVGFFGAKRFLDAFVQGGIYPTTSGVTHSAQLAIAHVMDEASEGRFDFLKPLRVYGERAKYYKSVFLKNGFDLVYGTDGEKPLADGFYFTVSYPNLQGWELLRELLYYGISVTTLNTFGSERTEGVRICVSLEGESSYEPFRERLEAFARDHSK